MEAPQDSRPAPGQEGQRPAKVTKVKAGDRIEIGRHVVEVRGGAAKLAFFTPCHVKIASSTFDPAKTPVD